MLDFDAYLERLASAEPTPGGGSAAALTGAMAAALVAMVARITLGSVKLASVHPQALTLAAEADALRAGFTTARAVDEAAYGEVVAASARPKSTEAEKAERTARLQAALSGATEAPLGVAAAAAATLALCGRAAGLGNTHLMSDVDCAVRFARAAFDASAANVAINHRYLKDAATIARQSARLAELQAEARTLEARALARVTSPD